jgi:hypothetical protein
VNRFKIVQYRSTEYSAHPPVVLRTTNKIRSARGYIKEEFRSHVDLLDRHDYFGFEWDEIAYDLTDSEAYIELYNGEVLLYKFRVAVEPNEEEERS